MPKFIHNDGHFGMTDENMEDETYTNAMDDGLEPNSVNQGEDSEYSDDSAIYNNEYEEDDNTDDDETPIINEPPILNQQRRRLGSYHKCRYHVDTDDIYSFVQCLSSVHFAANLSIFVGYIKMQIMERLREV